ncbi:MAG: PhoX family phosphatase [Betaproteobacteria bacterium]|nr:PhoX family phosphatase [Betaproteobacteria bacterium]
MNDRPAHDLAANPEDASFNDSRNDSFANVLSMRLSRRALLKGAAGFAGTAIFGGSLMGCGNSDSGDDDLSLGFTAVPKGLADALIVPAGYTASVLYRLGDPLNAATPDSANIAGDTGSSYASRAGDHHDGMHFFGMTSAGAYDPNGSDRGLLVMNHENITQLMLHTAGPTVANGVRTVKDEVDKEVNCHGVSVVEVARTGNAWTYSKTSAYNRRITPSTEMVMSGPAAGSRFLRTRFSPDGTRTRGTINNCANGYTPWGTYLTCEENWSFYFRRVAGDNANRTAAEVTALNRYGITQGSAGNYAWSTVVAADPNDTTYTRWNASKIGASADGTDDFRNVANTFGWNVEIDPFSATSTPKKRTGLGRFFHEGCWVGPVVAGRPIVFYSGCDSRNEYVYKYVSTAVWDPADATRGLAAGDKYLDAGKLFVARFNADGSGSWVELTFGVNGITSASATYPFADAADVLVHARLAADVVGATKMDRPEWGGVNPKNGEVYFTMTNNSQRGSTAAPLDAANPRYWSDTRGATTQRGNSNGHIIRFLPANGDHSATAFTWDIYLFAAQATADTAAADADYQANVNLSGLTANNDLSSPDGLWFSRATPGLLWIQTDDGAYTDVTNCMLLAALPGQVGDGANVTIANKAVPQGAGGATVDVNMTTKMGKKVTEATLRRFLVGPKGCEVTGLAESADGKALFVNIQHPGENTTAAQLAAGTFESTWPGATAGSRPRSSTIVITRNDGGKIAV